MKRTALCATVLCCAAAALLLWSCNTPAPTYAPSEQTATIGVSGGSITLEDNGGYTVTLTFPYGALAADTEVTLRSVGTAPAGPFRDVLYPGLEIEPQDLLLEYPARLEIQCPVTTDMQSGSMILCRWTDTLMAPLDEMEVNPGGPQIWGSIYLLGRYGSATPTTEEMRAQMDAWSQDTAFSDTSSFQMRRSAGDCPPDGYGWQGFKTRVSGMLAWETAFKALGSPSGDKGAADARAILEDMVTNGIMEFSTLAPPFNPCGSYIRAALRYENAAALLGVDNAVVDEMRENNYGLIDQCKVTFTYRKDIQSSYKEEKDGGETYQRTTSGYVAVNCSVSYWDLSDGKDSCDIGGQGAGEYSDTSERKYHNVENDEVTTDISENWTYTCKGSAYFDEDELVFKASFTIVGTGTSHTKLCDTREDVPCHEFDDTKSSRDTFSGIPLTSGYTIQDYRVTDDPALGTISIVEQITSADPYQPENPDPDGPCY